MKGDYGVMEEAQKVRKLEGTKKTSQKRKKLDNELASTLKTQWEKDADARCDDDTK